MLPVTKEQISNVSGTHCNFCKSQEQNNMIVFIAVNLHFLLFNNKFNLNTSTTRVSLCTIVLGPPLGYTKNIMLRIGDTITNNEVDADAVSAVSHIHGKSPSVI